MNAAAVATIAASLKELLYFFGWIYFSVKKNENKKIVEAVSSFNRKNPAQQWRTSKKVIENPRSRLSLWCSFPLTDAWLSHEACGSAERPGLDLLGFFCKNIECYPKEISNREKPKHEPTYTAEDLLHQAVTQQTLPVLLQRYLSIMLAFLANRPPAFCRLAATLVC